MKRSVIAISVALFAGSLLLDVAHDTRVSAHVKTPTPTPAASPTAAKPTPPVLKEDDEIIKIDTELVNLNVRVVDRNNRAINNVPESEFKIYEDGVPQQIDFFSKSEVPTNYGLVIDNSGSLRAQLDQVVEAGKILVNTNRPDDETMIIRFVSSDKIAIEQDFTPNKTELIDRLENLYIEGGQTAVIDALYLAVEKVDEYERTRSSESTKRRALVLVTDGEDRNSFYSEKQLFELMRESEVQIYVVGFVGDLSKEGGFISKSPQSKAKAFLERIATESGGKLYLPKAASELQDIARQISAELRTQYSIGYIPSNDKKDGTFRNIKVSVTDGPNNQKRIAVHRAGRTAEGGSAQAPPKPIASPTKNP